MAKKYLHSIELQNFKAFPEYENINIEGKHAIIWGVNGSGKSTVFWSLYTFLQCAGKPVDDFKKYFDGGDQDLKNIFGGATAPFVKLSFSEKDAKGNPVPATKETFVLDAAADTDTRKELIRSYYLSSEFISHRLLLNFSNFRNSQALNLWPYFERDILPYFSSKGKNLYDLLKEFREKINTETPKALNTMRDDFNNGLQDLILPLVKVNAGRPHNVLTEYYNENLSEKNEFSQLDVFNPTLLDYTGAKGKRVVINPEITLKAKFGRTAATLTDINKPHIFYNEARINGIALAIRFVLMENRTNKAQNNLLCLDDLLISLDMHNRRKVIELLLTKYTTDYQLLLFTHEKGFFNEFQRSVKNNEKDWKAIILRETPIDKNPKVEEKGIQTYYDKAKEFFDNNEYESCALFLRKEAERLLAKVFDPSLDFVWRSDLLLTLGDYVGRARGEDKQDISELKKAVLNPNITDAELNTVFDDAIAALGTSIAEKKLKSHIKSIKQSIQTMRANATTKDKLKVVLDKVDAATGRTLNPAAHFNEEPFFKDEMEEALATIDELRKAVK
ncbi:MAG: AAA family ATPase [Niastella sp.]|nr:AAA family ATPase [Niastella sp.]